jgi:hypothetical protein
MAALAEVAQAPTQHHTAQGKHYYDAVVRGPWVLSLAHPSENKWPHSTPPPFPMLTRVH